MAVFFFFYTSIILTCTAEPFNLIVAQEIVLFDHYTGKLSEGVGRVFR